MAAGEARLIGQVPGKGITPAGAAARMLVRTALLTLPGIRTARTSQLMAAAGIDPGRRAGALTARQRSQMVAAFEIMQLQSHGRRR
jgi:hypothetical protein